MACVKFEIVIDRLIERFVLEGIDVRGIHVRLLSVDGERLRLLTARGRNDEQNRSCRRGDRTIFMSLSQVPQHLSSLGCKSIYFGIGPVKHCSLALKGAAPRNVPLAASLRPDLSAQQNRCVAVTQSIGTLFPMVRTIGPKPDPI